MSTTLESQTKALIEQIGKLVNEEFNLYNSCNVETPKTIAEVSSNEYHRTTVIFKTDSNVLNGIFTKVLYDKIFKLESKFNRSKTRSVSIFHSFSIQNNQFTIAFTIRVYAEVD